MARVIRADELAGLVVGVAVRTDVLIGVLRVRKGPNPVAVVPSPDIGGDGAGVWCLVDKRIQSSCIVIAIRVGHDEMVQALNRSI